LSEDNALVSWPGVLSMPAHILFGLWGAKKTILEKRKEAQEKANKGSKGGSASVPSVSSMMSQAKSMMGSMRMPSMPH
jgi:hypothetical protein